MEKQNPLSKRLRSEDRGAPIAPLLDLDRTDVAVTLYEGFKDSSNSTTYIDRLLKEIELFSGSIEDSQQKRRAKTEMVYHPVSEEKIILYKSANKVVKAAM